MSTQLLYCNTSWVTSRGAPSARGSSIPPKAVNCGTKRTGRPASGPSICPKWSYRLDRPIARGNDRPMSVETTRRNGQVAHPARDLIRCREHLLAEGERVLRQTQRYSQRAEGSVLENREPGETFAKRESAGSRGARFHYVGHWEELRLRLESIDAELLLMSYEESFAGKVSRLSQLCGFDRIDSVALLSEVGDFERFASAGAFMAYLGLVPGPGAKEDAASRDGPGRFGNARARKILYRTCAEFRRGHLASPEESEQEDGETGRLQVYTRKAAARLEARLGKMLSSGKSRRAANAAIARELAGFVWGLMLGKY